MASLSNRNQGLIPPPPQPPPRGLDSNIISGELRESVVITHDTDIENQQVSIESSLLRTSSSTDLKCDHMELVRAAWKGDWIIADSIINKNNSIVGDKINKKQDTALHIATGAKQTLFVEKLVKRMEKQHLRIQNELGNTALCIAAGTGNLKVAKILVEIDKELLELRNISDDSPLDLAISYRHREIVDYIFPTINFDLWKTKEQIRLLFSAIFSDYLDIAMKLVEKNPGLAIERDNNGMTALHLLTKNPHLISCTSEFRLSVWDGRIIFSVFKELLCSKRIKKRPPSQALVETIWNQVEHHFKTEEDLSEFIRYPTNLLHESARVGNVKLLSLMLNSYPDLICECDANDGGKSIFHVALENRQERVFDLIHEIGGLKHSIVNTVDKDNNNMLHLAAQIASDENLNKVSGDALKMQREVMWFKEVEKLVVPSHLEMVNSNNEKPSDIFRKTHENLRCDGEKWMKNTTQYCMLVSTLIATVTFTAIFTIPGGSDETTGNPLRRQEIAFSVFVISDVIGLISSSTSIFIFLSILTSRYAQNDFLRSLPIMLLWGLTMMFISLLGTVLAFGAAFFMLYETATWVPWTAFAIVATPVTCFWMLQSRLWADVFHNTFWFKFLFVKKRVFRGFRGNR